MSAADRVCIRAGGEAGAWFLKRWERSGGKDAPIMTTDPALAMVMTSPAASAALRKIGAYHGARYGMTIAPAPVAASTRVEPEAVAHV